MNVNGQTFLITGGASGLGRGCVELFAASGANVVIADLNEAGGKLLANTLGKSIRFVRVDVTSPEQVQAAIDVAKQDFGGLHGAINCAGILHAERVVGKSGPHDLAAFRRVIEVNLIGTFNVVRLAAAAMSSNEPNADAERGVIINTSSIAGSEGQIGQAAYSASKAAVAGITLPIARELARFGIRVVAIAPGAFETAMMGEASEDVRKSLAVNVPFPSRFGRPDEFAALAKHIVENPMLNGAVIRLDGAMRLPPK